MSPTPSTPRSLPPSVLAVLREFRVARGLDVRVWRAAHGGWRMVEPHDATDGTAPGPRASSVLDGLLCVEVCGGSGSDVEGEQRFLVAVLEQLLRLDGEVVMVSEEIAERYEEINLLYSISETLGSVISVERAANRILTDVIEALGARRAALWVHEEERGALFLAAAVGLNGQTGPIACEDPTSVTAEVFRSGHPVLMDPEDVFPRGPHDRGTTERGYFLSVPVRYTPPQGESRTIGVINLVGRVTDEPYDSGDQKLLSAIASQVGAAVENGRLVAESLRQERMVREMELAHDLQLKLLPALEQFAGYADVAARCEPAESVGGDFYHLFRLSRGRIGVMIGDVSSHGFGAALIMALTMSAVAIHASEGDPPAEVLRRLHHALIAELESTEMFMTLFYGVIDPAEGRITYANAGHHHAFLIGAEGTPERLPATSPPFGMVDLDVYGEASAQWRAGEHLLFLFTDGLPDALSADGREGERKVLEAASRGRREPLDSVIADIFALSNAGGEAAPHDDRTAVLVRL